MRRNLSWRESAASERYQILINVLWPRAESGLAAGSGRAAAPDYGCSGSRSSPVATIALVTAHTKRSTTAALTRTVAYHRSLPVGRESLGIPACIIALPRLVDAYAPLF
jgi:hypothetical protein